MLEISAKAIQIISSDSVMDTYLNPSANDDRIYQWYPSMDITYTTTNKSAIIYRSFVLSDKGSRWSYPQQINDWYYEFWIKSIDHLKVTQIAERLIDLFDETSLVTTNYSVKHIQLISDAFGDSEGDVTQPIISRKAIFRFSNVFKR